MFKAIKYRLYPTRSQAMLLDKHINACRFVYNLALETKQIAYASNQTNLTCFDLINQLPELKKECTWLLEVNSQSLQQAVVNLNTAYTNFFKGDAEFPKFKSKRRGSQSFKITKNTILLDGFISIPKFKPIKSVIHRTIDGKIKSSTISKTPTGKYFASVLFETTEVAPSKPKITEANTIGIDLGIKDFAITSNGEKFANPKFLKKSISKLKFVQRKYSKYKGKRTKQKLALLHEKVANQRSNFLHQITKKLVVENQTIALEDLNVSGMIQNHKLAQSIQDVSWGKFYRFIEYKAEWYGANIIKIGRFEPSSRMSDCGQVNKELTLKERVWTCSNCKRTYDRDIQAAKNIKKFALRNYVSGTDTKTRNELPTLVGVLTCEAYRI